MKTKTVLDVAKCYKVTLNRLKGFYKSISASIVLDLGCGSGQLTLPLADIYDFVVGLDIQRSSVFYGKKIVRLLGRSKRVDFILGDGRKLPFSNSTFDIVFAFASLEHIRESNEVLYELNRVLKDDGFWWLICLISQ
ncbi:MAG: class I SAM-dependent methyltransferase [Promethearchaeota archaeon]